MHGDLCEHLGIDSSSTDLSDQGTIKDTKTHYSFTWRSDSGIKTGSIGIPRIAVTEDEALLAQLKTDMQVMVWDAENGAGRERYAIQSYTYISIQ